MFERIFVEKRYPSNGMGSNAMQRINYRKYIYTIECIGMAYCESELQKMGSFCIYNLPDKDGPDVSQSTCNKEKKVHCISIYRLYPQ